MSLQDLCNRDSITIGRLSESQGLDGSQVRSFTAAARGSLPTSLNCRIQPINAEQKRDFGIKSDANAWKIQATSNPSLTAADHVFFTDADGSDVEAKVMNGSRNMDGQNRLWMTVVEEFKGQN